MTSLIVAYSVVCGGVLAYVAWAGMVQRTLAARVASLEAWRDRRDAAEQDRAHRAA
jgi:drug/metabolite transporter (DMT)-like permease